MWRVLLLLIASVGLLAAGVQADTYTGSLNSNITSEPGHTELEGTGFWATQSPYTHLSWTVSENTNGSWNYSYDFDVPAAAPSHFIIETSEEFAGDDIFNVTIVGADDTWSYYIGTHGPSPGNPFMPDSAYGIKFEIPDATLSVTISFDSWRVPVWQDFYAKCGNVGGTQNTIWNYGFTSSEDDDPLGPAANGSLDYHILAPDSKVPEPATLLLFGLGLASLEAYRRRRRR